MEPAPPPPSQLAQPVHPAALKAPVRALFIRSWSWDSVTGAPEDLALPVSDHSILSTRCTNTTYPPHRLSSPMPAAHHDCRKKKKATSNNLVNFPSPCPTEFNKRPRGTVLPRPVGILSCKVNDQLSAT